MDEELWKLGESHHDERPGEEDTTSFMGTTTKVET